MESCKNDNVRKIVRLCGNRDKKALEAAIESLQSISQHEGLNEHEIQELVEVLTSNKIGSGVIMKLLQCLIPETKIANKAMSDLLAWFFCEVGGGRISKALERQFVNWITGIVHYNLGDVNVVELYFTSFLFLLRTHLEAVISKLLCLLLKPEDAKRWVVKKILKVQQKSGVKPHTNALLSILKSYRPDIVPEKIPMTRLNYENSSFHNGFQKAHDRKIQSSTLVKSADIIWGDFRSYDRQSANLARLIPMASDINFEPSTKHHDKHSVIDIRDMTSLGVNCLKIGIPTETLSLLANVAGFHVLAFSDPVTKTRFCHKLKHTLFAVFILELEPYSIVEKTAFLNSIIGLQEYMVEGIPVVTEFLLHYLLVWDGEECREQILHLLQWVVVRSREDWHDCFFRPLRQIFRSSGQHSKYLILESIASLLRNIIAFHDKRDHLFSNCPPNDSLKVVLEDIVSFANELIAEGILWNGNVGRRNILAAGLNFYEICSVLEYSEEFPVVLVMPTALVYGCLFSGSRVCLARLCSLLVRFLKNTIQKLSFSGHVEEYEVEVKKLNVYVLDCYRFLWAGVDFEPSRDSFLFSEKGFCEMLQAFGNCLPFDSADIFKFDKNATFWNGEKYLLDCGEWLREDYPSIIDLIKLCENLLKT